MLRSLLDVSLDVVLHPEVRVTVLVCVRVPTPQQQQHRTATPAAAAVYVASRLTRWSRVLTPQRVNPALLAVAVGRMFDTAAVTQ